MLISKLSLGHRLGITVAFISNLNIFIIKEWVIRSHIWTYLCNSLQTNKILMRSAKEEELQFQKVSQLSIATVHDEGWEYFFPVSWCIFFLLLQVGITKINNDTNLYIAVWQAKTRSYFFAIMPNMFISLSSFIIKGVVQI